MKNIALQFSFALTLLGHTLSAQTTLPPPVTAKMKIPALSSHAGSALAINETYLLSGSRSSPKDSLTNVGDVLVFRVADGSFVRRIVSPFPTQDGSFGGSVALYGSVAYIGAKGESPSPSVASSGAVYAFDLATGKLLWSAIGRAGQKIGDCLSVSGDTIAVGAPGGNLIGAPSGSGSVALLQRKTGTEITSIKMPNAASGDAFGDSVALQGRLLAAGAPFRTSGGLSQAGEVLLVDAISQQIINTISAGNKQVGGQFGLTLALCKDVLIVGSPFWDNGGSTDYGFVYLFNHDGSGRPIPFVTPVGSAKNFGRSLAAAGNMVLVGGNDTTKGGEAYLFDLNDEVQDGVEVAPHTSTDASNFGVAVAMTEQSLVIGDNLQPITGSSNRGSLWLGKSPRQKLSPEYRYARTNMPAPNCNGALYSSFTEPTLYEDVSVVMFRASLKGAGVTSTTNSAVFNDWSSTLPELIVRKGDKIGGKTVSALSKMFFNPTGNGWPIIQTTTGGVTTLLRDDGTSLFTEARVGAIAPTTITSLKAISSAGTNNGTSGFVYTAKTGANGITSASDSRMGIFTPMATQHSDLAWEGGAISGSEFIGQISPRMAASANNIVLHTAVTGTNTAPAILRGTGNSTSWSPILRKGHSAPGTTGTFSTFIGEGVNNNGIAVIRATTSNALEGLWMYDSFPAKPIAVKGDIAPGTSTGVKFSKFTRYFITDTNNIFFTATLTGPGVTTANDQGVWLKKGNAIELLLREGDGAPDCDGARIGTISALDCGLEDGCYCILTTLTGSTATNQALFYGNANNSTNFSRAPILNLRKGSWIDQPSGPRISSLSIGTHNLDAAGSGSKGTARFVNYHGTLVTITYNDASQELMLIRP